MILVFVGLGNGFDRDSSLILPLPSAAAFSVPSAESCDEDDDEVGEGVVEELVDKPGTTNGRWFDILQSILLPFLVRCGF